MWDETPGPFWSKFMSQFTSRCHVMKYLNRAE